MPSTSPAATDAVRRAAIVLASLGTDVAARIGEHLEERQVRALADAIAKMPPISVESKAQVLRDFARMCAYSEPLGGADFASEFMTAVLGPRAGSDKPVEVQSTVGVQRLYALNELKSRSLWRLLEHETPQTIAVVLTHLTAQKAADLLLEMPEELRAEVAFRAAHLAPLSPGTLDALASAFDGATASAGNADRRSADSLFEFLVDVVMELDVPSCRQILEDLKTRDTGLYQAIDDRIFTFDDTMKLADRDLQTVLRSLDLKLIAVALKGCSDSVRQRALMNLSQRAQDVLMQEMELMGPVPVTDVTAAQREVAATARKLAQSGEIATDRAAVQYVE
jgi:flagellar motor switch protein FliG